MSARRTSGPILGMSGARCFAPRYRASPIFRQNAKYGYGCYGWLQEHC
jgi:hypothetical protein